MKVIMRRGHHPQCFMRDRLPECQAHRPGDPWCLNYKDPHYSGDIRGGHRGNTTSWIRLHCLDPKCKAEAVVEEFGLWELVNREMA
jgi:hypothetical protein